MLTRYQQRGEGYRSSSRGAKINGFQGRACLRYSVDCQRPDFRTSARSNIQYSTMQRVEPK